MTLFFDTNVPPYIYLSQILKHCPNAGNTYLELWRSRDKNNQIQILRNEIRQQFLTTKAKFENDLIQLVREGLISVEEKPNKMKQKSYLIIEIVDFEEGIDE